jgi:Ca-activated chloride channel family protein
MFREFGIRRTTLHAGDQSDHDFGRADTVPSTLGTGSPLPAGGAEFGSGRLGGSHVARAPQIRMGATRVSGRLPPETIQRTVRLQMRRFRACYERGLARNPNLAGRVSTRFVIDRAGAVSDSRDAGSDLADPEVVACVVRHFRALEFPRPPGSDIVTVTYPIMFQSDGTRPKAPATLWPEPPLDAAPRQPPPEEPDARDESGGGSCVVGFRRPRPTIHVDHARGDERWRSDRAKELESLEQAAALAPTSRAKRERWVRALMHQGRFDRAADEARRFVELDPDLPLARELLAQSEAVLDRRHAALDEVDALAEADPRSHDAHRRAARAFAATGDDRRACAHWRSLAELEATRASRARADSCILRATTAPAEQHQPDGAFQARVECESETPTEVDCPSVAVVTPSGRVVSRAAPFGAVATGTTGIALLTATPGLYRTVLFGGDPHARGRVHLTVHGNRATFSFDGGGAMTVATTKIEERWWRPPVAAREVRPIHGVAGALAELQRHIHEGAATTGVSLPASHRISGWPIDQR